MSVFQLEPFQFDGQPITCEFAEGESYSRVFAAIAARYAMLDPEVAADIRADVQGPGSYQAVFHEIMLEFQQMYLFGGTSPDWFFAQVRAYETSYPNPALRQMVDFAEANPPRVEFDADFEQQFRAPNPRAAEQKAAHKAKRKKKIAQKSRQRNRR